MVVAGARLGDDVDDATLRLTVRSVQDGLRTDQHELQLNCTSALKTIQQAIEETRSIAMDLSPAVLEDLGFRPAIRNLAAEVARRSDLQISIIGLDSVSDFRHPHDIHIYRIIQEALTKQYHDAFRKFRRQFGQVGATVVRVNDGDPVQVVLDRLDRLRGMRSRR